MRTGSSGGGGGWLMWTGENFGPLHWSGASFAGFAMLARGSSDRRIWTVQWSDGSDDPRFDPDLDRYDRLFNNLD
jgi:hypothetical protein